jgi:hypothetical protein
MRDDDQLYVTDDAMQSGRQEHPPTSSGCGQ